ncbi:MAG: EAL domain-containing protein [Peptostreptococcaceae bacterium]
MKQENTMYNSMYLTTYKIYNNTWIKSIRYGLLKVQPIILINCILILMLNIDSEIYNKSMEGLLASNWKVIVDQIYNSLYKIMKILTIISVCSELAKIRVSKKSNINYMGNNISINIVGFIGITAALIFNNILKIDNVFELSSSVIIDANWTLISIVIGIVSSEIYIKVYYYILETKKDLINSYDKVVRLSFLSILPSIITITLLVIITFLIKDEYLYVLNKLNDTIIYGTNGFFNDLKYIFLNNALWTIGGHGGDLIIHQSSFNRLYVDTFSSIGGSGNTICLIIAIIIYSTNKYSKKIAKISIIPSVFNINETIMYGLPILFNPIYIIPFIIVPIVSYIVSYVLVQVGFMEIVNTNISWIDPIIYNAYELTGGYSGIIVQLINISVGVAIYTPFVRVSDAIKQKEREVAFNNLKEEVFSEGLNKLDLDKRIDNIGDIGIFLGVDLKKILKEKNQNNNPLYLEYQPQLDKNRRVVGVEALLRWKHKEFGNIPPNIIIIIAEELGLIYDLGKWISKEAISQLSEWSNQLQSNIDMSINISTKQLRDENFASSLVEMVNIYGVNSNNIKLEITESFAVGEDDISKNQLKELTSNGIKLAIDDFGVGYNPILYIKKYKIDSIKIDGSLIRDIDVNEESQRIVSAMYKLCESTGIKIVNEFVETDKQKHILDSMGDGLYQGYLFSKPLSSDECLEYIKKYI